MSSLNWPTAGMNSSWVPGNSLTTPQSAISSSWLAHRDGTALPRWSLWLGDQVLLNPIAPAARPARSKVFICSSSASVAWRAVASSCITTRRRAEWPTRKPAFGISRPSSRSRYSAVDVHSPHGMPCCRLSSGMPSTRASMRIR